MRDVATGLPLVIGWTNQPLATSMLAHSVRDRPFSFSGPDQNAAFELWAVYRLRSFWRCSALLRVLEEMRDSVQQFRDLLVERGLPASRRKLATAEERLMALCAANRTLPLRRHDAEPGNVSHGFNPRTDGRYVRCRRHGVGSQLRGLRRQLPLEIRRVRDRGRADVQRSRFRWIRD